jgi:hypothetical protein
MLTLFGLVGKEVTKSDYYSRHVCPSICPHRTAQLQPGGFPWNFVSGIFHGEGAPVATVTKMGRNTTHYIRVISGCSRKVAENCALLGYYAASSGNFVTTFRDNLSVPSTRVIITTIRCVTTQKIAVIILNPLAPEFFFNISTPCM